MIRGAGARTGVALGASLLFAAHPIHTEAVAYVSGRPDLLATVCALGALALARSAGLRAGGCRSWRVWPAYALLAVAVLADEVALVTPLLLVGLDRWGSPRVPTRGRATVYWGFAAVAAAAFSRGSRGGAAPERDTRAARARGRRVGAILAAYETLRALVVPYPLDARHPDHGRSGVRDAPHPGDRRDRSAALFVAAAARPGARGRALLALPLVPALPIPPFQGAYVEERAAYFASVGFCFLAGSAYAALGSRGSGQVAAIAIAVVIAGAGRGLRLRGFRSGRAT